MVLILILFLVIIAVGSAPAWPYARGWGVGYYPSGFATLLLLVLLVLYFTGHISIR